MPVYPEVEPNLDLFARAAASQGFITNQRESGVSRRQGLAARFRGAVFPALPLRAVAAFTGEDLTLTRDGVLPRVLVGERPVETDGTGRLWLSWPGPAGSFTVLPIHRVLDGAVEPEALAGKLVFVGATETGIGDFTATPFGPEVPGVLVQAATADNLLTGRFLEEAGAPRLLSLLALCLLGPLAAFLVASVEHHLTGSLVAIVLVVAWPAVCFARLPRPRLAPGDGGAGRRRRGGAAGVAALPGGHASTPGPGSSAAPSSASSPRRWSRRCSSTRSGCGWAASGGR